MRFLGVPEGSWGVLWIFETLWYTWENETPGCTRRFMGFSGFLKPSGTLGEWDSWMYQRVHGVLWIFETLWYTWENETPGCTRGFMGFFGFLKPSGTLGSMRLLRVLEGLWISLSFWNPLVHFKKMRLLSVPDFHSFLLIFRGGTDFWRRDEQL